MAENGENDGAREEQHPHSMGQGGTATIMEAEGVLLPEVSWLFVLQAVYMSWWIADVAVHVQRGSGLVQNGVL